MFVACITFLWDSTGLHQGSANCSPQVNACFWKLFYWNTAKSICLPIVYGGFPYNGRVELLQKRQTIQNLNSLLYSHFQKIVNL